MTDRSTEDALANALHDHDWECNEGHANDRAECLECAHNRGIIVALSPSAGRALDVSKLTKAIERLGESDEIWLGRPYSEFADKLAREYAALCPHGHDPHACWTCTPPSEADYT